MRQWGAVVAAAVLIPLVACSPPHVGPVQYNPLPAALALWKDFPAGQDPRPIVWLGNASPVNGFSTPEAWESAACGFFTLNAHFPTDYSTYSVVTGPDNESGSYLTIPAGEALWALSRGKGQTGSGSGCGATAPLVISAVRLGSFAFDTDRGKLEIPAWLFTATGASGDLAYPAIAPIAFWNRGMSTDSFPKRWPLGPTAARSRIGSATSRARAKAHMSVWSQNRPLPLRFGSGTPVRMVKHAWRPGRNMSSE